MKRTLFGSVIAVAAILVGCTKNEVVDLSKTVEFETITARRAYRLEDTAREFNREHDVTYTDSASLLMPRVLCGHDLTGLRDTILSIAFDTICNSPTEAISTFFDNTVGQLGYNAVEIPDSLSGGDMDGLTIVCGDVFTLSNTFMTYRVANYTYLPGAAHGMNTAMFVTFDLKQGDIITLDELFTPDGLEKLPEIISKRARALESLLGSTNISSLPSDGNFYITLDDEIVFVYQPYEVASYAQGLICVPFYPYQFADLLSPRGLAFFNLSE